MNTIETYFKPHPETGGGGLIGRHNGVTYSPGVDIGFVAALATVGYVKLTSSQIIFTAAKASLKGIVIPPGVTISDVTTDGKESAVITFLFA